MALGIDDTLQILRVFVASADFASYSNVCLSTVRQHHDNKNND